MGHPENIKLINVVMISSFYGNEYNNIAAHNKLNVLRLTKTKLQKFKAFKGERFFFVKKVFNIKNRATIIKIRKSSKGFKFGS